MKQTKPSTTFTNTRSDAEKLALATGSLSALSLMSFGAQADIIYTANPISINMQHALGIGNGVTWSVDGSHATFKLWNASFNGESTFWLRLASNNASLLGRGLVRQNSQGANKSFVNLGAGFVVGPTLAAGYNMGGRTNDRTMLKLFVSTPPPAIQNNAKNFTNGVNGYFGFKFTDAGLANAYYGWAELNLTGSGYSGTMTINRWAYNNVAGQSIKVGQTAGDNPSNVPEPDTLSLTLLGLGAGGVRAWRKRKLALAA